MKIQSKKMNAGQYSYAIEVKGEKVWYVVYKDDFGGWYAQGSNESLISVECWTKKEGAEWAAEQLKDYAGKAA
jgi:hypothetical protein